jgi:Ribbon-helix-helix protein, copG family
VTHPPDFSKRLGSPSVVARVVAWYADSMTVAKIAVTVPRETLAAVEKRRRVLGVTRSAVVTAALEEWLAAQTTTAEEREYLLAYRREPETSTEIRDTSAVAKAAVSGWEPWDSSPPRRKRAR